MTIECRGKSWRVRARHRGLPRIQTTVRDEALATHLDLMLKELAVLKRRDIYDALKDGSLSVTTVWNAVKAEGRDKNGVLSLVPVITPAHTVEWLKAAQGPVGGAEPSDQAEPCDSRTFEDLFATFKEEANSGSYVSRRRTAFAPDTIDRYDDSFQELFKWDSDLRRSDPRRLTANDLEEFRKARAAAGVSVATLNRDQDAVQSFFTWLETRHPALSPAKRPRIGKLREPAAEDHAMTLEDFQKWSETLSMHPKLTDSAKFIPIFAATVQCGLRIDEAQGLRRCDVIRESGRPVRFKVEEYPGHRLKSSGAAREVGISAELVPVIEQQLARPGAATDLLWEPNLRDYHRAQYAFERTCIVAGLHDNGKAYLVGFQRELDELFAKGEITEKGKTNMLNRAKAKVPTHELRAVYTMHSLRHTCATQLDKAGVETNVIRMLLGQRCISTTQRYLSKSLADKEAAKVAAISSSVIPLAGLLGMPSVVSTSVSTVTSVGAVQQ
jgi:site-specific recombinase XerD